LQQKNINIKNFSYQLPEEKIAKYPLEKRDASKLLLYREKNITEIVFSDISKEIEEGSLLIFNNTRVIQARLMFQKETGAKIEIFCLEPHSPADFSLAFSQRSESSWKCIVGNFKKWKTGKIFQNFNYKGNSYQLEAELVTDLGDAKIVKFNWQPEELSFGEVIDITGVTPIPPYLNREAENSDTIRYQTVYSKVKGSVAAPTAGLHFTSEVFDSLKQRHISTAELTLHVGAGTFKPVKSEQLENHEMHTEHFFIDKQTVEKILFHKKNCIAVGTTSVRTVESLYWIGVKVIEKILQPTDEIFLGQWEAYELPQNHTIEDALQALLQLMEQKNETVLHAATQIIIAPPYNFKIVKGIITNFHQPQSTLLLLIAAFTGDNWRKIYDHALENNFRFLSYGDSSFLT